MDTLVQKVSSSMNDLQYDHGLVPVYSNQNSVDDGFKHNHNHRDSFPCSGGSSDGDSDSASASANLLRELNQATLKYMSDILMEEDLEGKTCMLQDCLAALQAAEKPFYEVLGQKYPFSPYQTPSCFFFKKTPSCLNQNSENPYDCYREIQSSKPQEEGSYSLSYESRGRKSYQLEDSQGRSNKHLAKSVSESEPSEVFDAVLLCNCHKNIESEPCPIHGFMLNKPGEKAQQDRESKLSGCKKRPGRKKKGEKPGELVDLWSLLTVCAQAVANYDQRTANGLLKQIRQHSSAFGDGTQRLAHYFASGLEVRLAGTQTPISTHLCARASASDVIQAYKMYILSCPFNRMSFFMSNSTIMRLSEKATRLHIIDFGIGYGFQWPCFIHRLSLRPGGPPKLRITGIEFPQSGFRPAERVEETGRRLKSYCDRFNVPFEYNAVAQKWETIRLEDLKMDREEITVVNCMYRMRYLPDETVTVSSPRDAVLELIKSINPDIFIHGVINGAHNAPYFLPRFREALFHFSTLFDMLEATVPREDQGRMLFEREIYGKDAMNVIACEGIERVERPETYKQWHARNQRIGFRQLPLDRDVFKGAMTLAKHNYHGDFVIDEDGQWMLHGWKGRICYALSFWKPAQEQ